MEEQKIPHLFKNWISTSGAMIAAVTAFVILFFLVLSQISRTINPYIGIVIYLVLPAILILGLLLIPIGMFWEWRERQKTGVISYRKWPSVDLNNPGQRKSVILFLLGSFLFMLLSSVGMYQAYHYTESVEFCGLTCHKVMEPEHTAYQASPHARVLCVECHIGSGAGWYARSKLAGLYQVYAVARNMYPRPIPTPIEDLRPAQDTCEHCHWPRQFFGAKQREFVHHRYDRDNSAWPIDMLIRIGGGSPRTSQTVGIHWHMNIAMSVQYVARDPRRQDIPWITATDRATGRVTVYQDSMKPLTEQELAAAPKRTMDCMDCHNRPSHNFQPPDYEADLALSTGLVDAGLPEIKKIMVESMVRDYPSTQQALQGIAGAITDFYRVRYPAVAAKDEKKIGEAIQAAQQAYARNIFPIMKARWSAYPNDIGHFIFPGCMRCHDGNHVSASGTAIPNNCRTCHIILSQGPRKKGSVTFSEAGLDFIHPVDIGDSWKQGKCYECHSGVQP